MKKKIVIGNWKMNFQMDEAINFIIDLKEGLGDCTTVLCVPFPYLSLAQELVDDRIALGAQNVCQFEKGAYTGEISAGMLQSLGTEYVIVGHSERRGFFNETDAMVNTKVLLALKHDLCPIICIGENLAQRENNDFLNFLKNQLLEAFKNVDTQDLASCIVAYEPIWAIGTGKQANLAQIKEVHAFLKNELIVAFGELNAEKIQIIYGGSVKAAQAKELFSLPEVEGALVGSASLDAKEFTQIIKAS